MYNLNPAIVTACEAARFPGVDPDCYFMAYHIYHADEYAKAERGFVPIVFPINSNKADAIIRRVRRDIQIDGFNGELNADDVAFAVFSRRTPALYICRSHCPDFTQENWDWVELNDFRLGEVISRHMKGEKIDNISLQHPSLRRLEVNLYAYGTTYMECPDQDKMSEATFWELAFAMDTICMDTCNIFRGVTPKK